MLIDPPRPTKIAFVNLHSQRNDWGHMVLAPLGLLYLSGALKRAFGDAVSVRVHDMLLPDPVPGDLDAVRRFLSEVGPDLVGIRGFTSQADEFASVARAAKEIAPRAPVVAGGPHASALSETLFNDPRIDFVATGEGEGAIVDLVRALRAGGDLRLTPGLAWSEGGERRFAPPRPVEEDLDALPRPDYDVVDLDRYQGPYTMAGLLPRARYASLFTSRGCHYRCAYCHDNFGKAVRYRGADDVLDEMASLIETRGVREFQIVDDIFNADEERAIRIFDGIVARGWKIHLAFPNGLRGDVMSEEFVAAARAAGAYYWGLAVESASPRIQRLVKKHNRLDRLRRAIDLSDRYGILTATFNILGFPTETDAEMESTVAYSLDSPAHLAWFFVATPFEGTALRDLVAEAGFAPPSPGDLPGFLTFSGDDRPWFATVPRAALEGRIQDAYRRFYLAPERLRRLRGLVDLGHDAAQLAELVRGRLRALGLGPEHLGADARSAAESLFGAAAAASVAPG